MRTVLLASLVLTATALAQEQPIVRMTVSPEEVNVGESAELQVTVLVPTWFAQPPVFPSFEVANAVTRLPPNSSYPTSQRVGRETWSGIVRTYEVYPLSAAVFQLGGDAIKISAANPGSDPVIAEVAVPEVSLRAIVPAGAEGLNPYIAGTSLMLTRDIDGDLGDLKDGDAIVIRTVAELDGLPAMFLPPLSPALEFDGVSVYADEPVVEDGDVARRTEAVTLVFEAGGEFSLPGVELDWWDMISNGVATAVIPEVSISVVGPALAPVADEEATETDWQALLVRIASLVAVLGLGWRILRRLRKRAKQVAAQQRESEAFAFMQFAKACKNGDAKRAHHALLVWLNRIHWNGDSQSFARAFGDKKLPIDIDAVSTHVYHDSGKTVDLAALLHGLRQARQNWRTESREGSLTALPSLNP